MAGGWQGGVAECRQRAACCVVLWCQCVAGMLVMHVLPWCCSNENYHNNLPESKKIVVFSKSAAGKVKSEELEKLSLYCKLGIIWTAGRSETAQLIQGSLFL